ncbi:MAG: hypothetical protein U1A27_02975 [Phycisphaerae bacterium]
MSAPALALVAIDPAEPARAVASVPGEVPFVAERPIGTIAMSEAVRRAEFRRVHGRGQ